uniref:Uncharacterized protein n=1 Tax=Meloidogyne enterolobii TaxID=390850 RepID=A0A6V7UIV5_MELEN|nr:unnamed protein product [Meloidogyne enterolobii]
MSTKLFKLIQLFLFFVFIIKIVNCGCCCSTEDEDANIVHQPQQDDVVPDEIDQLHEEYGGWDEHDGEGENNEVGNNNVVEQDAEDDQIPQVGNFEDLNEENNFNFPPLFAHIIPDFDQGDDTTTTSLSTGPPRTSSDSN